VIAAVGGFAALFAGLSSTASRQSSSSTSTASTTAATRSTTGKPGLTGAKLEFGSEGIGAGQFKDARSIAIDGEGRMYVGEYQGGRIQVFDSNGAFLTQWMADRNAALLGMTADRKGVVYVVNSGSIFLHEGTTGRLLGKIETPTIRRPIYRDVTVALDGKLYAVFNWSGVARIEPGGESSVAVAAKEAMGEDLYLERVAVDGNGFIYALDTRQHSVFKFSPEGRFVNRFGGSGDEPGQLRSPHDLAVDGRGRVYVSDSGRSIQVFDGNGRHVGSIGGAEVVFGLTINDRNEIFACYRNLHKIIKFDLNDLVSAK
jgi:DNA-binding beta-propeller fold protein YncE